MLDKKVLIYSTQEMTDTPKDINKNAMCCVG